MRKNFLLFAKLYLLGKYNFLKDTDEAIGTSSPVGSVFRIKGREDLCFFFKFSQSYVYRVTMNVTLSNNSKLVEPIGWTVSQPVQVGTYRISNFWGHSDYWWLLGDEETWFIESGVSIDVLPRTSSKKLWKPNSYADQNAIFKEVIQDVSSKLDTFVFPLFDVGNV